MLVLQALAEPVDRRTCFFYVLHVFLVNYNDRGQVPLTSKENICEPIGYNRSTQYRTIKHKQETTVEVIFTFQ
jgi:hypothetical protein